MGGKAAGGELFVFSYNGEAKNPRSPLELSCTSRDEKVLTLQLDEQHVSAQTDAAGKPDVDTQSGTFDPNMETWPSRASVGYVITTLQGAQQLLFAAR